MEEMLANPPRSLHMTTPQRIGLLTIMLLVTGVALWFAVPRLVAPGSPAAVPSMENVPQAAFVEATGARIVLVALTAQGGMVDVRYQVVDPDKAVVFHDDEKPLRLIDEASGRVLDTPWHSHEHDGAYTAGVTYYQLLVNAGGVLKRGSLVTVMIGDVRLEHVPVQ